MLHFHIGKTGTGKTESTYREVARCAEENPGQVIILVPPQSSHDAERKLCKVLGDKASLLAEALTFRSLATRLFEKGGGLSKIYIDDASRLLLLYNVQSDLKPIMSYFRGELRPEILRKMLETINELKLFRVTPAALASCARQLSGSSAERIRDLALLYAAYDQSFKEELRDPADIFDLMLDNALKTEYFKDKHIWIDGFYSFTPGEYLLLDLMAEEAKEVTVNLTIPKSLRHDIPEEEDDEDSFFLKPLGIYRHFLRLAVKKSIPYDEKYFEEKYRFRKENLRYFESYFCSEVLPENIGPEDDGGIKVILADDLRSETEAAVSLLLSWIREGARYRDIAVVARDMNQYREELTSVLNGCGVPFYMDMSVPVTEKPFFRFILSSVDAAIHNYSFEAMEELLGTGMTGISYEDRDFLSLYVRRWSIRGSKWENPAVWKAHPDGYLQDMDEQTEKKLSHLEQLRVRLIGPLSKLKKSLHSDVTHACEALYLYVIESGAASVLSREAEEEQHSPELRREREENSQLWSLFCDTLDRFVLIAGERKCGGEEFLGMLEMILSTLKVGAIPQSRDAVSLGEIGRFRPTDVKRLIVLGNNSGEFPKADTQNSLITESDRIELKKLQIELDLGERGRRLHEIFLAYQTFFSPSDCLALTARKNGRLEPSVYVDTVLTCFPGARCIPNPCECLYLAAKHPQEQRDGVLTNLLREGGFRYYEKGERLPYHSIPALNVENAEILYGNPYNLSPTAIEKYYACRLAFFYQYGLRLDKFTSAKVTPKEEGTYVHYVFGCLTEEIIKAGGITSFTEEQFCRRAVELSRDFYQRYFGSPEYKNPRTDFLFDRMERNMEKLAGSAYRNLLHSDFTPFLAEHSFGPDGNSALEYNFPEGTIAIKGRIDRADVFRQGDKEYSVVFDYKTNEKEFSFSRLFSGLDLQLLLYGEIPELKSKQPAGVFYLPTPDKYITVNEEDKAKVEQKFRDAEKYSGIFLQDSELLAHLDARFGGEETVLPCAPKDVTGEKSRVLLKEEDYQKIILHVCALLHQLVKEMGEGELTPNPYKLKSDEACNSCPFRTICGVYEEEKESLEKNIPSIKDIRQLLDEISREEL